MNGFKTFIVASLFFIALPLQAGLLESDEKVLFFPDIAVARSENAVDLTVQAWVYEDERERTLLLALLARQIGLEFDTMNPLERRHFAESSRLFQTDSDWNAQISVAVGDQTFALPATNHTGRTTAVLRVNRPPLHNEDIATFIPYQLRVPPGVVAPVSDGRALLVPNEGVSIVSDIDDTIKITEVRDRRKMMLNTFINPYRAVPGMSRWYRNLAQTHPGIAFHYVSGSPMQLYPILADFLQREGFPPGSFHLRESTSLTNLVPAEGDGMAHKIEQLTRLLQTFPQRRFILIGDSGEKDPEIYAKFARDYPKQILSIHIRDVTGEPRTALRYKELFHGLPETLWEVR